MNIKILHTLNIVFLVGTLVVNYLANALPIGGYNTGQLSDMYPTLFTPAGFTFAIWGIIYLMQVVFTTYLAWGIYTSDEESEKIIKNVGFWYILLSIANMAWIFLWHHQLIGIALIVMICMWLLLFKLYTIVDQDWIEDNVNTTFSIQIPISIYLGWISVALIANTAVFLTSIGWNGFGISPIIWTMIILGVVGLVGMFMLYREGDTPFVVILMWALWGIFSKPDLPEGSPVARVCLIVFFVLLVATSWTMWVKFKHKKQWADG